LPDRNFLLGPTRTVRFYYCFLWVHARLSLAFRVALFCFPLFGSEICRSKLLGNQSAPTSNSFSTLLRSFSLLCIQKSLSCFAVALNDRSRLIWSIPEGSPTTLSIRPPWTNSAAQSSARFFLLSFAAFSNKIICTAFFPRSEKPSRSQLPPVLWFF